MLKGNALRGKVFLSLADLPERLGLSPKREQFANCGEVKCSDVMKSNVLLRIVMQSED